MIRYGSLFRRADGYFDNPFRSLSLTFRFDRNDTKLNDIEQHCTQSNEVKRNSKDVHENDKKLHELERHRNEIGRPRNDIERT